MQWGLYVSKGRDSETLYSILNCTRGYVIVNLTDGIVYDHCTFATFDDAVRELTGPLRARKLRIAITDILGIYDR
jgi:hypothetical protein